MMDAFRRLGHEVRTVGEAMGVNIWGMTVDSKYEWKPEYPIHKIDPRWPELVVVMDSDPNVWKQVDGADFECPIVVFGVDNHVRDYESDWAHQFLAHYHGPIYPVDPTRKDHTWLPCATDTKLFTPSPIAWADRDYDICMVGVMYPRRVEVLNALKDAGFKVFAATGLLYDEYRAAYHNSRISLCVSAAGDVAQRIFETGGMGCAILTDPLLDFADEMTNKALHLFGRATYTTPQEAVNLARELLGHQPQAFQIDAIMPIENSALGEQAAREIQRNCLPHTWEARAQVIVNWFEREYGKVDSVADMTIPKEAIKVATEADIEAMRNPKVEITGEPKVYAVPKPERKPFLNLGCGTTHFPGERPPGHEFITESVYAYPDWLNVDKVEGVGADKVFDLFAYPWPLESNSFDGAILGHIAEHIPHEVKVNLAEESFHVDTRTGKEVKPEDQYAMGDGQRYLRVAHRINPRTEQLSQLQDGWYAFFSELYRVLTPGAIVHIISPYAWSQGAVTDPTHTRLLTEHTFSHGLAPDQYTGTFKYNIDCNFAIDGHQLRYSPWAQPFMNDPDMLATAIMTRVNMIYDFYVKLRAVK
jgi:hypothetical protein